MSKKHPVKLSKFEEEVMAVLWRNGASSVHQVIEALPDDRKKNYTSVSTILRILEGKKVVRAVKQGKSHLYSAHYSLNDYTKNTLVKIIENAFSNKPAQLVSYLIDNCFLSKKDLQEIEIFINEKGEA